ncbi:MAG TPA: hypothetical protein VF260_10690 [Bacilli bacterium]
MAVFLAILGALLGLFATGTTVFTLWYLRNQAKKQSANRQKGYGMLSLAELAGGFFLRWTVWDYAVLLLFVVGIIIQLADLLAMFRDRVQYPGYHFTYLLSGFVYVLLGMMLIVMRLAALLKVTRSAGAFAPHDHHEPNQADPAE